MNRSVPLTIQRRSTGQRYYFPSNTVGMDHYVRQLVIRVTDRIKRVKLLTNW